MSSAHIIEVITYRFIHAYLLSSYHPTIPCLCIHLCNHLWMYPCAGVFRERSPSGKHLITTRI